MPIAAGRLLLEFGGLMALCVAVAGWWVEHNHHEVGIGVAECQAKVNAAISAQTQLEIQHQTEYEQQLEAVDAQHQEELAAIAGRVVTTPVRVCHANPVRPGPVPQVPAAAQNQPAGAGGSVGGPGDDNIRPQIEQFKARVEMIVADCRAAIDLWPQ